MEKEVEHRRARYSRKSVGGQKYVLKECIGQGTYGFVYKAVVRGDENGPEYAIKKFKVTKEGDGLNQSIYREVSLLREYYHENIIDLVDIVAEKNMLSLVTPYAEYDLAVMIKEHIMERRPMSPQMVKAIMWQLLDGVNYMHQNWMFHRDLKPSNILVMAEDSPEPGVVKIADFGLARLYHSPAESLHRNGNVVTIWYRAPELLLGSYHYTPAIDIWACGCIFGELLTLAPLFQGPAKEEPSFQRQQCEAIFTVLGNINSATYPGVKHLPKYNELVHWRRHEPKLERKVSGATYWPYKDRNGPESRAALNLLSTMLHYDPTKRTSALEAMKHAYFAAGSEPLSNVLENCPIGYKKREVVQTRKEPQPQHHRAPAQDANRNAKRNHPGHHPNNASSSSRGGNSGKRRKDSEWS